MSRILNGTEPIYSSCVFDLSLWYLLLCVRFLLASFVNFFGTYRVYHVFRQAYLDLVVWFLSLSEFYLLPQKIQLDHFKSGPKVKQSNTHLFNFSINLQQNCSYCMLLALQFLHAYIYVQKIFANIERIIFDVKKLPSMKCWSIKWERSKARIKKIIFV